MSRENVWLDGGAIAAQLTALSPDGSSFGDAPLQRPPRQRVDELVTLHGAPGWSTRCVERNLTGRDHLGRGAGGCRSTSERSASAGSASSRWSAVRTRRLHAKTAVS
jgi:hypothetical protein